MIDCIDKKICTGCGVCSNVCPEGCIVMSTDQYGFWYPKVDYTKCIKCGLCIKVCPIIGDKVENKNFENPKVFAAWSLDEETRSYSTSGGVFSELAKDILNRSGCVVGARYTAHHLVEHFIVEDILDLPIIRQSKYIQSFTGDIFKEVRSKLKRGKVVGFCGTPCQVAGLLSFLKKSPTNLYTFDFICRGINSPKAYLKYLEMLEKDHDSKVSRVWFKNKTFGWNKFSTRVDFENGDVYIKDRNTDLFMRGYIEQNLYMRACCFDCRYKTLPRGADITLGDFWGISKFNPDLDQNLGTSLVMLNSEKGEKLFNNIKSSIYCEESNMERALSGNACILKNAVRNPNSEKFLLMLDKYSFEKCFNRIVKMGGFLKFYNKYIRLFFSFINRLLYRIKGGAS